MRHPKGHVAFMTDPISHIYTNMPKTLYHFNKCLTVSAKRPCLPYYYQQNLLQHSWQF